ncbi:ABC transporter permease [Bacillus fungorum]|uniref:ABC transporter permease n=1 Tax=Bacillus fungorum TaxID=2039284 RepID=A0A2G6QKT2_9BACI|nr:ABC-2 transporter permease [Bacillus fungorum]PIE97039.1 ABC transporter permease [Bacillus fungorum]
MFYKALWLHHYKQSKYILLLFACSSFWFLPISYFNDLQIQLTSLSANQDNYFSYSLNGDTLIIPFIPTFILLACSLISWERQNQTDYLLFAMPFTKKELFLSKWLFGTIAIIFIMSLNIILMYFILKINLFNQYQSFGPILTLLCYVTITWIAIFTIALFIGTIAGNVISHSILSLVFIILPYGLSVLLFHFTWVHTNISTTEFFLKKADYTSYVENIEVFAPTNNTYISYSFNPEVKEVNINNLKESVKEHHQFQPIWKLTTPILYILILLPLGIFFYNRTKNENNGKILLFTKLHRLFILCVTICFALLGGRLTGEKNDPILSYYAGFIIIGVFSYVILNYFINKKFLLRTK